MTTEDAATIRGCLGGCVEVERERLAGPGGPRGQRDPRCARAASGLDSGHKAQGLLRQSLDRRRVEGLVVRRPAICMKVWIQPIYFGARLREYDRSGCWPWDTKLNQERAAREFSQRSLESKWPSTMETARLSPARSNPAAATGRGSHRRSANGRRIFPLAEPQGDSARRRADISQTTVSLVVR
jgi:hypothetical protein